MAAKTYWMIIRDSHLRHVSNVVIGPAPVMVVEHFYPLPYMNTTDVPVKNGNQKGAISQPRVFLTMKLYGQHANYFVC